MTDSEYNRLVELRNKCYQDRRYRETEINYFTGFNDGYEKGKESLAEELKNWKDEWQEQVQKATDEGYARTLQTMQISKAKELLKGWLGDFYNPKAFYQQRAELVEQSEQFLKDEPQSKWVNPARTTNDNQIKLSEVEK